MAEELLVARRDGVTVLTLNRPERLNALTEALHAALLQALADVAADPDCRAVLLQGTGRGFCAGQDLTDITSGSELGDVLDRRYNKVVRAIRGLPKPVVCAVQGVAAGAGANMAFACDIVLAGQSARFIQSFIRIGLVPDSGGTWLLPRLAGDARARGMALLGDPVSAANAERWGLIWRAVPDEALAAEAETLAARLAAQPTHTIGLIKHALDASAANTLDAQLDLERDLQREAGRTPDYHEGVAAFVAKRPATFTGRANELQPEA